MARVSKRLAKTMFISLYVVLIYFSFLRKLRVRDHAAKCKFCQINAHLFHWVFSMCCSCLAEASVLPGAQKNIYMRYICVWSLSVCVCVCCWIESESVLCFTRFEQHLGDTIASEGWTQFYVCIVFHTLWATTGRHNRLLGMGSILRLYCVSHALSNIWATQSTPRDLLNSTFVLCFTRFEQHLGDTIDSEGWAKFYGCIVFYTLWATSGRHNWLRWLG